MPRRRRGQLPADFQNCVCACATPPRKSALYLSLRRVKGCEVGEVADDVGQVAQNDSTPAQGYGNDAIDALVLLVGGDLLAGVLDLQQYQTRSSRSHGRLMAAAMPGQKAWRKEMACSVTRWRGGQRNGRTAGERAARK